VTTLSALCYDCNGPVHYAVVAERPDGTNAIYCPTCAALVPDTELPSTTRDARMCRMASRVRRWRTT
jgi:hypothetical protein